MDTLEQSSVETTINFSISANEMRKDDITALLGVEPTRAFEKGERYLGRERLSNGTFRSMERVRPWGVWHFRTKEFLKSDSVDEHALFLLEKLAPARDNIRRLLSDSEYRIIVTIWYVGPSGFSISAEAMSQLALLCGEIGVTCWEVDE